MRASSASRFVILIFLATIISVPLIQVAAEARRGRWPQALEVFSRPPTTANLRAYERELEESSVAARALRPWMQAAQFIILRDAGNQVLRGRGDWLFYQPGMNVLTQRPGARDSTVRDALSAVVDFRDQLSARGIRLLVVPAPNKESMYPDRLARRMPPPTRIIAAETRDFLAGCERAGVEVVDLFAACREARTRDAADLYLAQDSHWSPAGVELAATAVAERILTRGWITPGTNTYMARPAPIDRTGDLVRMLRAPPLEAKVKPESIACRQVVQRDTGAPYQDDPSSDVLVLGDSFLRIYAEEEPGHAGFVAHLAHALGRPVTSVVNDGGASTLVRQELIRRPKLLAGKRVVVWEFVERDLRLGTDGWQIIPLPGAPSGQPR